MSDIAEPRDDVSTHIVATQRTKGVDSARRALQILLQFSETPELTVDNLIEAHDISVPSAYRYIALLREMNLIEEHRKGEFVLSPQVIRLGRAAEVSLDVRDRVQPILERLRDQTGESALYLRRSNDSAVCVAIAESDHPIRLSFQPGSLMPLHGGAAAKLLLADYSKSKRSSYLDRLTPQLPAETRVHLDDDLDRIRETGHAESRSEVDAGVWATAGAVRVHGNLMGAITVAAPDYRLSEQVRTEIGDAVTRAARDLENVLGGR